MISTNMGTPEISVAEAKKLIHGVFSRATKQHSRVPEETRDDYNEMLRALSIDGGCGGCRNRILQKVEKGREAEVILRCRVNFRPKERARATDMFAVKFNCNGFGAEEKPEG